MSGSHLKPNSDCEKRKPASCVLHHTLSKNDAQIFFFSNSILLFHFMMLFKKGFAFCTLDFLTREREKEAEIIALGSTEQKGH